MTDEQINVVIAESLGWRIKPGLGGVKWIGPNGEGCKGGGKYGFGFNDEAKNRDLPNYCGDLNEMHEAEKQTFKNGAAWSEYYELLADVCGDENDPISATAAQRARAFLETLGLWDNGSA